jgi:hypothetical protein
LQQKFKKAGWGRGKIADIAVIARDRRDPEKAGISLLMKYGLREFDIAKPFATERGTEGCWSGCMKPVLRQKTTIYRYFLRWME